MSGKEVDVRIVPHGIGWAVKLTGGLGNKPVKVTDSLELAELTAAGLAIRYQVPVLYYDAQGSFIKERKWKSFVTKTM